MGDETHFTGVIRVMVVTSFMDCPGKDGENEEEGSNSAKAF